jgi:hypothetical protein
MRATSANKARADDAGSDRTEGPGSEPGTDAPSAPPIDSDSPLADTDGRLDDLATKVGKIEVAVDQLARKLGRLDDLAINVGKIEEAVDRLAGEIGRLAKTTCDTSTRMGSLREWVSTFLWGVNRTEELKRLRLENQDFRGANQELLGAKQSLEDEVRNWREKFEILQEKVRRRRREDPPAAPGGPDLMALIRTFKHLRNQLFPRLIGRLLRSRPAPMQGRDDHADLELFRLLSGILLGQDDLPDPDGPDWGRRLDKIRVKVLKELGELDYLNPSAEVVDELAALIDRSLRFVSSLSQAPARVRFPATGDVFDSESHEPEIRSGSREGRIREVLFPMLARDDGRPMERAWVILGFEPVVDPPRTPRPGGDVEDSAGIDFFGL